MKRFLMCGLAALLLVSGTNFVMAAAPANAEAAAAGKETTAEKSAEPAGKETGKSAALLPLNQREARRSPEWIQKAVLYQINTRAFTPEGTLKAAAAKLPLLRDAGVTVIYFCPLFTMDADMDQNFWSPRQVQSQLGNPKNPYRMNDYDQFDPEYGTADDAKALIQTAHELGLKVMFDLVYLHCGPRATLVQAHPEFFRRNPDGSIHLTQWKFPEFDFSKPEVREYFWQNMEMWVRDFNVDGFRMDVADGIPLDFWEEARVRIDRIRPDVCFFAEGTRHQDQLKAFDWNYGFPFFGTLRSVFDGGKPALDLRRMVERMAAERPVGARIVHYLENHDLSNDDYQNRIEKRWGGDGVEAALALIFTLDGAPMLYCGQEIADVSRHSLYGSRTFGNCVIDWSRLETETGRERFALCRKFSDLRLSEDCFTSGKMEWLENDQPESVLSFCRTLNDKKMLVVIRLKRTAGPVRLTGVSLDPKAESRLSFRAKPGAEGTLELGEYGWWIGSIQ